MNAAKRRGRPFVGVLAVEEKVLLTYITFRRTRMRQIPKPPGGR
jgi:hypothetical protein